MKKTFALLSLALVMGLTSIQAQKTQPDPKSSMGEPLVGVIEYKIEKAKPKSPKPATTALKTDAPKPMVKEAPCDKKPGTYALYADKKQAMMLCNDLFYLVRGDDMKGTFGARFGDLYHYASLLVCDIPANCGYIKEASSLFRSQEFSKLKDIAKPFYTPTGESREIAGQKCTGYKMHMEEYEGTIWVAEELTIPCQVAPFWGLYHPVLECEFRFPIEGLKPIHIIAEKIVPNEFAMEKALEIERQGIRDEARILLERIRNEASKFNQQ